MSASRSSDISHKSAPRLSVPIGELLASCRGDGNGRVSSIVGTSHQEGTKEQKKNKSSLVKETVPYFCSVDNFECAAVYLSQELQGLGLGKLNLTTTTTTTSSSSSSSAGYTTKEDLSATFGSSSHKGTLLQLDLVCLVNRCWEVVQLYRASVRDGCALQDQHRRDACANSKLQASISGLQDSRQESERKVQECLERRRQVLADNSSLEETLRLQKEETRHLTALLQQRDSQYQHEARKQEAETASLKQRLAQLVSGAGVVERRLEQSAQLLAKEDRGRAKWKTVQDGDRHSVEVYRRVLTQYECWLADLSTERDGLKESMEATATTLVTLARRYAKVLTPEDMAASLTDSVYSTDSLDEPLTGCAGPAPVVSSTLQKQMAESLLAISVILAERSAGDLREARIKRINELTASAHLYNPRTVNISAINNNNNNNGNINTNPMSNNPDLNGNPLMQVRAEETISQKLSSNAATKSLPNNPIDGIGVASVCNALNNNHNSGSCSNSAIMQLAKHLGIIATTHSADAKFDNPGECSDAQSRKEDFRPSPVDTKTGTPTVAVTVKTPTTSTPELQLPTTDEMKANLLTRPHNLDIQPTTPNTPNTEPDTPNIQSNTPNITSNTTDIQSNTPELQGNTTEQSWLQNCGGPDDSTATEVMTLKRLLEEERDTVKKERDVFAQAALRLNRERAQFEQDKVSLLSRQFLQRVPGTLQAAGDVTSETDAGYQASRVPAWLSDHHSRPFSPQPSLLLPSVAGDSLVLPSTPPRLTVVPTITPPPPPSSGWEGRRSRLVILGHGSKHKARDNSGGSCDSNRTRLSAHSRSSAGSGSSAITGRRSAPTTRAPSLSRSAGDGSSVLSLSSGRLDQHGKVGAVAGTGGEVPTKGASCRRSPSARRRPLSRELSLPQKPAAGGALYKDNYSSTQRRIKNSSREPSVTRLTSKSRDSSTSRSTVTSRESSSNRSSSILKNASNSRESSSGSRYCTLPKSSKLASHRTSDNLTVDQRSYSSSGEKSGINLILNTDRESIVSRVALHSRQGAETPPSRYAMRNAAFPRSSTQYTSNSLPRQLGKAHHPHLISSITDGNVQEEIDRMRHAKTLERPMHRAVSDRCPPTFDITTLPGLFAATRYSMAEGKSQSSYYSVEDSALRPKSDSFTQAVHVNDLYASLPPEFVSRIGSNEVFNSDDVGDSSCSGDCKQFLNIPPSASCLCHLLKRKKADFNESPSSDSMTGAEDDDCRSDNFESVSQVESRNIETNARINAIENSLMNLITRISAENGAADNRQNGSSSSSEFTLFNEKAVHRTDSNTIPKEKEKRERSNTVAQTTFRSQEQNDAQKRLSAGILELQGNPHRYRNGNENDFVSSMSSKHRNIKQYNTSMLNKSSSDCLSSLTRECSSPQQQRYLSSQALSQVQGGNATLGGDSAPSTDDDARPIATASSAKQFRSDSNLSEISSIDGGQLKPGDVCTAKSNVRQFSVFGSNE